MSVVIAVCTNNYKLMMADSRITRINANNPQYRQVSDTKTRKYRVMNKNTCIGAAGDYFGVELINYGLPKIETYTIDDYAKMIIDFNEELNKCHLNTMFILVGLDSDNKNSIITLSREDNFKLHKITARDGGFHAYRVAMPFMPKNLCSKFIKDIDLVLENSFTDREIENGLKRIMINMSRVDITIDDHIRTWRSCNT